MTSIYALLDPETEEIKYIGKSNNPKSRMLDHMKDFRGVPVERLLWIDEMKRKKLKPILEVLDQVPIEKWQFWEEWWIGYFKSLGANLFNKKRGGNGLTFCNWQTFKDGHKPWNYGKKKIDGKYI